MKDLSNNRVARLANDCTSTSVVLSNQFYYLDTTVSGEMESVSSNNHPTDSQYDNMMRTCGE
jgi:hypothetical protein